MTGLDSVPSAPLLIAGFVFLVAAGFFSAVEIALSALSRAYVDDLVEAKVRRAPRLAAIVAQRERAVVALHAARVVALTIAVLSVTLAALAMLAPVDLPWWAIALIVLGVMGVVELLIVLVLPWLLVSRSYLTVALAGSGLTAFLITLTHWLDPLIFKASHRFAPQPNRRMNVAEDLRELADEVGETEGFDDDDRDLVRSVFEMGQTIVREVMVPRTSMVTIGAEKDLGSALRLFVRSGFSRMPVIGADVDDVVGILYFKDVVRRLLDNDELARSPVRSFVRPTTFVPETRLVDDELRQMQTNNTHLALVVDEYGGIAGLVTLEDLLEELVGEVVDEHDRAELEPERLGENRWRVPARYGLIDLEELLDIEIDEESVDSVGGLLSWALDRVPLPGAEATSHGLHLQAEETVGRRNEVGSIVVTLLPQSKDRFDGR